MVYHAPYNKILMSNGQERAAGFFADTSHIEKNPHKFLIQDVQTTDLH